LEGHAWAVSRRPPTAATPLRSRLGYVGFMVDKVVLSRFSPRTTVSLANSHSNNCSLFINHLAIEAILQSQY
jgi:hypothetical protein